MKHLMFLLTALLMAVATSTAQTTQVATLSHEGTISTFYSANALKDAYAAAVDGDIITLSSGTFLPVDLAKNITIRGAGMELDNNPSIISGSFSLRNTATETNSVTLEGLYVSGTLGSNSNSYVSDVRIIKCYIKNIGAKLKNFTIANCILGPTAFGKDATGNIINSHVSALAGCDGASLTCTNCVIRFDSDCYIPGNYSGWMTALENSHLKNCILTSDGSSSDKLDSTTTVNNCYHFGTATNPFQDATSKNCALLEANPFDGDEWKLTEEAKAVCVGDDGTEAGIYGGLLPFDPTPTNPQITKFNVASKTTADGKLSVDIEVKANN